MPWQSTSRVRIATALGYSLDAYSFIFIDGGMVSVEQTGQSSIDYVEKLLADYDVIDLALANAAADAGLIQADVLHWSDRAGGKLGGLQDRLALIAGRIAATLGLAVKGGGSQGGACAVVRSRS